MPPSATSDGPSTSLLVIDLAYDSSNSDASARALIYRLHPDWKTSEGEVEFVRFKDGITNTLFKAIKRRPGYDEHQINEEAVLLRAYGNGTHVIIDREREAASHALLAKRGLAPPLLARFNNGLLYRFIEGSACTPELMRKPDISQSTARRLGQWHAILNPADLSDGAHQVEAQYLKLASVLPGKPMPNIWTVLQKWIHALPNATAAERTRNAQLQEEMLSTVELLGSIRGLDDGDYIIGHCDLLSGNIIIQDDDKTRDVNFIDYEYATPAPAAFDLANYFSEWCGFDCDFSVLPTRKQRRDVLQHYVASYRQHQQRAGSAAPAASHSAKTDGDASKAGDRDVEALFSQVDLYRGVPGLYWGVWALIQATISQIDFDYASYAEVRLGEYYAYKAETNGSRARQGQDVPLRERRWAQEE